MKDLSNLVGNTPLFEFAQNIFAKLEFQNPSGSVKDRAALAMIEAAEKSGELKSGGLIVEPTSGNTGIALAALGGARGYRVKLVMPESMSVERRKLIEAYGAEVVLTSAAGGMPAAIAAAEKIVKDEDGWMPNQFENPANLAIHFQTTGPEIFKALPDVQIFVAGVGTGGTVSGVGRFLKSKNSAVKIVAVEPEESSVLSGGEKGAHKIQGIGAGFIPKNFDSQVVDEVIQISSDQAFTASRELAKRGLLVGISSGANFAAAEILAERFPGQKIATIFCDGGERYLSTELFR
ncbi:MAG: cysteine synthase A [Candidatus Peribacteraceae bacterium]|nr:cysteine synthase A [Candidatus Peribacteraceae bacterium]